MSSVAVSDMRFAHTEGICNLVYARDGDKVYTAGADGEVRQGISIPTDVSFGIPFLPPGSCV